MGVAQNLGGILQVGQKGTCPLSVSSFQALLPKSTQPNKHINRMSSDEGLIQLIIFLNSKGYDYVTKLGKN